jgi:hypothetical protein
MVKWVMGKAPSREWDSGYYPKCTLKVQPCPAIFNFVQTLR